MVYLISINYKKLLSVDLAFCESYTCLITDFRMIRARKLFIKMQQNAKAKRQKKEKKEKSWRTIMDRKRKSRPTSRSSRSSSSLFSNSSRDSTLNDMSGNTTPNDSCSSDAGFLTGNSGLSQNLSDLSLSIEETEIPVIVDENVKRNEENTGLKDITKNFENAEESASRQPFSQPKEINQSSDARPVKKMKTADGCKTTLQDLNLGDGILTRRRLPKVNWP